MSQVTHTPLTKDRLIRAAGLVPSLKARDDLWTDEEAFRAIRKQALTLTKLGRLGYDAAEDAAADLAMQWITLSGLRAGEGRTLVRARPPAYIRRSLIMAAVDAQDKRIEAHESLPLSAQPIQHDQPESDDGPAALGPVPAVWAAMDICKAAGLPRSKPILACLIQGLTDATAAETANVLGVGLAAWKRRVVDGRKELLTWFPDAEAAAEYVGRPARRRTRPVDKRTLGRRHISGEARETELTRADLLIAARPPAVERPRTAARMGRTDRHLPATAVRTSEGLHGVERLILGCAERSMIGYRPPAEVKAARRPDAATRRRRTRRLKAEAAARRRRPAPTPPPRPILGTPSARPVRMYHRDDGTPINHGLDWHLWPNTWAAGMAAYTADHPGMIREYVAAAAAALEASDD